MRFTKTITCREDLSFTHRDSEGTFINWPRHNPGVARDWKKGKAFFDREICALAAVDETEAFHAVRAALMDMCRRCTNLEIGFADSIARAAVLGLRAVRDGAGRFEPVDTDD